MCLREQIARAPEKQRCAALLEMVLSGGSTLLHTSPRSSRRLLRSSKMESGLFRKIHKMDGCSLFQ
jgi:hypothetical protein